MKINKDETLVPLPITPLIEMGAYELLWLKKGASFRSLGEIFAQSSESLPSDFVPRSKAIECSKRVVEKLCSNGVSDFGIQINHTPDYPQKLCETQHSIELLYYRGVWKFVESKCVSVVGTRNPSSEGIKRARRLTEKLVQRDITVVSGLAKGIDTEVHKTAIEKGGRTIAIIGTPIHRVYPPENSDLQNQIANEHLLISQVPVLRYLQQSTFANRLFFLERNKTISAISDATIIIEASESSGTLSTARAALNLKRKLFIPDSCFQKTELLWPNKFARRGAIRVRQTEDIWKYLD